MNSLKKVQNWTGNEPATYRWAISSANHSATVSFIGQMDEKIYIQPLQKKKVMTPMTPTAVRFIKMSKLIPHSSTIAKYFDAVSRFCKRGFRLYKKRFAGPLQGFLRILEYNSPLCFQVMSGVRRNLIKKSCLNQRYVYLRDFKLCCVFFWVFFLNLIDTAILPEVFLLNFHYSTYIKQPICMVNKQVNNQVNNHTGKQIDFFFLNCWIAI